MLHNGYLVHPDIWMLWFSFIVAVGVTLDAGGRLLFWIVDRVVIYEKSRRKK